MQVQIGRDLWVMQVQMGQVCGGRYKNKWAKCAMGYASAKFHHLDGVIQDAIFGCSRQSDKC